MADPELEGGLVFDVYGDIHLPPHPTPPSPSLRIAGTVYPGVVSSLVWFFFLRQP
ncbi:hypothetical protein KFK09_021386 [Dendrobium nobile]|uniref:Uncharacterized protein n=1 Tax=Dendrobium nobile TaxID=94219 RepID=A0A8T3AVQ1_DENNO|nr:hypothetical protein KFK09_021386 [Dendrobium nobile]